MTHRRSWILFSMLATVALLVAGCSGGATPTPESTPTPTATPLLPTSTPTALPSEPAATATPTPTTPAASGVPPTPEPLASACAGLGGQLEMQVLVGPADAVGLEPFAVGSVPFSVTSDQEPYTVQGGGDISYADTLEKEWGIYEVTLDLQTTLSGECVAGAGGEALQLTLNMAGRQMVEVEAEAFHGEYPWSGEVSLDLSFPLTDGATAQGEGWVLVLHLQTP
jgi:hypothetical protein